ncbi:hypothetical protein QL093DRAFT_2375920 [Fusarium oxysporum]|nr:hypothetical protein QL093DRAFT_2375920 [Fusarium oxysporum]
MNPALAMVLLYLTTASAEDWDRCRCMKYPETGTPMTVPRSRPVAVVKHRAIYRCAISGPEFYRTCYGLLQDPKPNSEADSCCTRWVDGVVVQSDGCFK